MTRIERKKKGHRLVFESDCPKQMSVTEDTAKESVPVYILPSLPTPNAPVVSACVSGESLSQVKKKHRMLLRRLQNQTVSASQALKRVHV